MCHTYKGLKKKCDTRAIWLMSFEKKKINHYRHNDLPLGVLAILTVIVFCIRFELLSSIFSPEPLAALYSAAIL